MANIYPVVLIPFPEDEGEGFMAYAPDLPGCMSDGDTQEEALANVRDAIEEWICEARESGQIVPGPGSGADRLRASRDEIIDIIRRQTELIEEQNQFVEATEKKSQALEAALAAAQERSEIEDSGWLHISAIAERERKSVAH